MCTEKYLKEVWRFFECTPPQIQNIMVNFGVKSSPYWPARKKKLIILLENFNNYLSEAAVNKGGGKGHWWFGDHSSIKLITERGDKLFSFQYCEQELHERYLRQAKSTEGSWLWFNSQRLLRLSAPAITQLPTKLINNFITYRLWPMVWTSSNITTVFIKAAETNKTCYQLVTILTPKNYKGVVAG